MPLITRDFVTVPGTYILSSPYLYAVRLLGVEREGTGQTNISVPGFGPPPAAGSREFIYFGADITFASDLPFNPGEKITVLYEI